MEVYEGQGPSTSGISPLPPSREQTSPDQKWTSSSTLTSSTNSLTNEKRGSKETSPITQHPGSSSSGYPNNHLLNSVDSSKHRKVLASPTEESMPKEKLRDLDPKDVDSEFDLGSVVEVDGQMQCKYGVIRWFGYLQDKNKPIVGLEMVSGVAYVLKPYFISSFDYYNKSMF